MPLKPRIQFLCAPYHVIAQGNRQEPVFNNDAVYPHVKPRTSAHRDTGNASIKGYAVSPYRVCSVLPEDPLEHIEKWAPMFVAIPPDFVALP